MELPFTIKLTELSQDPRRATQFVSEFLFKNIHPVVVKVHSKLQQYEGTLTEEDVSKLKDVFVLCLSQIRKSFQSLFDIFKTEYHEIICLQESRQCTVERLCWCVNRLLSIEQNLDKTIAQCSDDDITANNSLFVAPIYFVNWIDHTFDVLSKLAVVIYKDDYKDSDQLFEQWKEDVIECVSSLHISIDELLMSAMTLCKYCLPADQLVIKARCQVVLRESKSLLSELIKGDCDTTFKASLETLKLPIMPSNVNVLIDVLKDVLYILETNTNTALLALLIHCFSNSMSPVDVLKKHFEESKGSCSCLLKSEDEITEDCSFVKEFDLYNERLLQIGSFAVSCSSDQGRILTLRSGLASLEALDPHLVPALLLSPESHHAKLLIDSWKQEVKEIRDTVFLIVDPGAFAEKSKQLIHQTLLDVLKQGRYNNSDVTRVIDVGCVVYNLFAVYNQYEPEALVQHEKLLPLLADLNKVQMECKIVSNLLCSEGDFIYETKVSKNNKETTLDQLKKRLKLLYTLINRIHTIIHPKENEEQLFGCETEEEVHIVKNVTHTVNLKIAETYVNSPRKVTNMSRSIFARTTNTRSCNKNNPLSMLTKNLAKKIDINFSLQLDELFNLSDVKMKTENVIENKRLSFVREKSVLYNYSPKKRSSLRKAVLSKHCNIPTEMKQLNVSDEIGNDKELILDEATSLQITEILDHMSDMTNAFSRPKPQPTEKKHLNINKLQNNVIQIDINNATVSKKIWNIPINTSTVELALDDTVNRTSGPNDESSKVNTLERLNDIDLVEFKLNNLKSLETTL